MDPRDVLTDEEAEALRDSASEQSDDVTASGGVRNLDVDHWERIAPERLPALDSITERLVSLLKTSMHRVFRRTIEISSQSPDMVRWDRYVRRLNGPVSLNVLDIEPLGLKGLIRLDADFVFVLVDLLFGGTGDGERNPTNPDLTPTEIRVVRKLITTVTEDLKNAWSPFVDLDFRLGTSENNPVFAAIATSADHVCRSEFTLDLGGKSGVMEILVPMPLVEAIRFAAESGGGSGSDSRVFKKRIREDLQDAVVNLRGVLLETQVSLRELAVAQPGDIIETSMPSAVTVYAGDRPVLEGTFGVSRGKNAIRVSKPASRRALGDEYGQHKDS